MPPRWTLSGCCTPAASSTSPRSRVARSRGCRRTRGVSMSWQAVQWALRDAPMLTTEAGKNDTTARFVLVALAEKARGETAHAFPSITTIRVMTGLDREVIRRSLQRLAAGGLITDVGRRGEGVVDWRLNTHLTRP